MSRLLIPQSSLPAVTAVTDYLFSELHGMWLKVKLKLGINGYDVDSVVQQ